MPAALAVTLTDDALQMVAQCYETAPDAETRTRYQMILLAAQGQTAPQIAPLVRRSVDTVVRVLHRYHDEGVGGVPHRRRPGRPSRLQAAWAATLQQVIDRDPHSVEVPSANWTTRLLADYLAAQTGQRASIETVRRHLHQIGYVCKRPTWTLQRKAEEQPEWAKNA